MILLLYTFSAIWEEYTNNNHYSPKSRAMVEWLESLAIIRNEMNPRQLSITIDFTRQATIEDSFTIEGAEVDWEAAKGLAQSLAKHVQLSDVFFHFIWPVEEHESGIPRNRGVLLEKMAMGENYDSTTRGKPDTGHNWNEWDECADWSFREDGTRLI